MSHPIRRRLLAISASAPRAIMRAMLAALAVGGVFSGAQAEPRQAPNSRIALEVPASFVPSPRFSGFRDEASGSSFLIVEMPGAAYDELKTLGDSQDALAQKGLTDAQAAQLPGRSGDYVYITAKQKTAAGDYGKHILVMRENDVTAMITANIPAKALADKTVTPEQVERALASATVKAEAAKGQELFQLSYLGPFKPSLSIMGTSRAYSLSGKVPEPGSQNAPSEPIFVVAPSIDKTQIADVKQAAQHFFGTFAGLSGQQVKSEKEVSLAGLRGYQIVGEGQNPKSEQTAVYIVLLSGEEGGYYMLAGSAPASDMGTYLPEFEKIAAGFQPKAVE